jgi:GNAT superfamily N-acetyltransferase/two-component sensor histidine kinase
MAVPYIRALTPELEERIRRNPSLNIDSFIIPAPFVAGEGMEKDYDRSFVWEEEREILGFIETYSDRAKTRIHIYKQTTSPFGRGKGIGSAFLTRLAEASPADALIDIYVWERQAESVAFFKRRGFSAQESVAWRALTFIRLEGSAALVREAVAKAGVDTGTAEELGRIRHDAKKAIRLIADMAGALSAENCSRIIEDINRETTALVNTLNLFRDSVQRFRTVNLKELVLDRIVPMVEHSPVPCELRLRFAPNVGEARAHYLEAARAIVNLVSNALDSIRSAGRPGVLSISLEAGGEWVTLAVEDNGEGFAPDRLKPGPDGRPLFVGVTTKADAGEGQGTRQIYAAFGAENISVKSEAGRGAKWTIRLPKAELREEGTLQSLETRWTEFRALTDSDVPDLDAPRSAIAAYVWRNRKLDILVWDLILQFSRKNNVRELYRDFLAFRHGLAELADFRRNLDAYLTDSAELRLWLADAARLLHKSDAILDRIAPEPEWTGIRLKAYGQAAERTVIFTLDPGTGNFGAVDRKLAEHADFVPYLGKRRDELLRGEFFGDVQNPANPIQLGVWEIGAAEDARRKASLIRAGTRRLIAIGIPAEKKLLLYETTWRRGGLELDAARPRTLGAVAAVGDDELGELLVELDDEGLDYITTD